MRVQRPPGLVPSSVLGLVSLTGELDEFGFGDFLNGLLLQPVQFKVEPNPRHLSRRVKRAESSQGPSMLRAPVHSSYNPKESDTYIPVDMYEGMEVRLGLSKGPVSRSFF